MKLQNTAPLSGLIMAGGFSSRLGRDKFAIPWHGLPQWQYLGNLLSGLGLPVYISCRKEQAASLRGPWPLIPDAFGPVGPAGGILSAMEAVPQTAFLVIACDMPLVDAVTLR